MKKPNQTKKACDLISLVANAILTDTIEEAEDYLVETYQGEADELVEHSLNVLSSIKNKQTQYETKGYLADS